jgi:hypothetical protein
MHRSSPCSLHRVTISTLCAPQTLFHRGECTRLCFLHCSKNSADTTEGHQGYQQHLLLACHAWAPISLDSSKCSSHSFSKCFTSLSSKYCHPSGTLRSFYSKVLAEILPLVARQYRALLARGNGTFASSVRVSPSISSFRPLSALVSPDACALGRVEAGSL